MISDPRHIRINDYNYPLPDERIAKFPMARRDHSKLLVYRHGEVSDDVFYHLPDYLPSGALMVFNNTKVIQARMHFRKSDAQGQPTREVEVRATRGPVHGTSHRIDFEWTCHCSFAEIIDAMGELPIPPYLNRETQESDKTTYQTVYSKIKGSVAAPTAGLHFTPEVLADLDAHGIDREELTLHVGAGTFKPVKSEEIEGHEMHTEYISVRRDTIRKLIAHEGQAIAVGTTSVRTLESLYYMGLKVMQNPDLTSEELHVAQWEPYEEVKSEVVSALGSLKALLAWMEEHQLEVLNSSTQIIIAPGYDYKIVKMLVTNFHQPQSTLLLLVSAFVKGDWHKIYDYALAHDFRFLSYGDSSLLIP